MKSGRYGTRRWIGVLVAAVGGIAIVPLLDWLARMRGPTGVTLSLVLAAVVAGVSAWLLRTWWALLIVPAVYFVGFEVGAAIEAWVRGSLYSPDYALQYLLLGAAVFVYTFLAPLLLGAASGTSIAWWLAQRRR